MSGRMLTSYPERFYTLRTPFVKELLKVGCFSGSILFAGICTDFFVFEKLLAAASPSDGAR